MGTHGSQAENDWALAKARFDAETFWYRGNSAVEILRDQAFHPAEHPDRSVVLYGNEDTNLAFDLVLDDRVPIRVQHGKLDVDGVHQFVGEEIGVLFVQPRKNSDIASVAVVGGTGLVGMRTLDVQPYFVSGVGYPDWTVFTPECFENGSEGIVAAGFFDVQWGTGSRDDSFAARASAPGEHGADG